MKTTSQLLGVGRAYNPKGGAPPGNRNALKTGQHTGRNRALRRQVTTFIRHARAIAAMVEARAAARSRAGMES